MPGADLAAKSRRFGQGLDARTRLAVHAHEPGTHEDAVDVSQGHHVGHGAQGDEVQELFQIGFGAAVGEPVSFPKFAPERRDQIPRHADSGDHGVRVCVAADLGIYDGIGVGKDVAGRVMIGDDEPQAETLGHQRGFDCGDSAVGGDHAAAALARDGFQGFGVQPVAFAVAAGKPGAARDARAVKEGGEERRRGHAVGVEIGVDPEELTRLGGAYEALYCVGHAGDQERVGKIGKRGAQEGARGGSVGKPARGEHTGRETRNPEFACQAADELGVRGFYDPTSAHRLS